MDRIVDIEISKTKQTTTIYIDSENQPIVLPTKEIRYYLRTILKYLKMVERYDILLKLES
jgi:hypothetical protein